MNIPRSKARFILGALSVISAFGIFFVSAALFGPWWRFKNFPTAEEWSAFFGASALVALVFAWYQIRQVDLSNKELIASNEAARTVNLETIRPRVNVSLAPNRLISKKRGQPARGELNIALTNTGLSPAQNLRLSVDPPFASLSEFFQPNKMDEHFASVNKIFDGKVSFEILNPGGTYIWYLGLVPRLFQEHDAPRKYTVEALYDSSTSAEPYRDVFILDFDIERKREHPVDPLVRIGRDLEVVGDQLSAIVKKLPNT